MEWKELSNEAKSIIEWVENPYTGERMTLEVNVNKEFLFPYSPDDLSKSVLVTRSVYDEVLRFVTDDKDIQSEQFLDGLIFKIRDDSTLTLH